MTTPVAESERWFRELLDAAPSMIWVSGANAQCTYFNRAWLAYTGRTMEQELGDGWAEGVHPDDLGDCVKRYLDHFARRAPFRLEYRLRRKDGTFGWLIDDGVPRYDADGRFLGFIGSCVDVSEQKEAASVLRTQVVTRALAAQLLQEVVRRGNVSNEVLRDIGRSLVRERGAEGGLATLVDTFRGMGLGHLEFVGAHERRYHFTASGLLERHANAALPTCALTLGFVEGSVGAVVGGEATGSETRCQSQGHLACEFVVTTR